jgi:hypothetical protein
LTDKRRKKWIDEILEKWFSQQPVASLQARL